MKFYITIIIFLFSLLSLFAQDFSTYQWKFYNTSNSIIKNNMISEILFDTEDNAWVTTNSQGLYKYDGIEWEQFPFPKDWQQTGWLNSIYLDPQGKMWIAGCPGYLLTFDTRKKQWDRIEFPEGQPWKIKANSKGVMLIGVHTQTEKGMLYQYKNQKFTLLEDKHGDPFDIFIQENGDAIASFRKGSYTYALQSDGSYENVGKKFFKHPIYEFDSDSKGDLWATSYNTQYLHHYKNERWNIIPDAPKKIYYDFNGKYKYVVHNVLVLPDDRALITTQFNASIAMYNGTTWEAYNLPLTMNDGIGRVRLAPDGSIWCATWKNGIYIFYPDDSDIVQDNQPISFIPDPKRKANTIKNVKVPSQKIIVDIKDNKQVDGDIVSLYFNGEIIWEKATLTDEIKSFELELKKGKNEILLYAHNLGKMPPNTAMIHLRYDKSIEEIKVNSDYNTCGRILVYWDK